jgi:hypothetical protein
MNVEKTCFNCEKNFITDDRFIKYALKMGGKNPGCFCCNACRGVYYNKELTLQCGWCNKTIIVKNNQHKKSKSGKSFCSKSCAAKYNNTHKTTGNRRSKLEIWLEEKLTELYENLEIKFNHKNAINSELDIYIPSLNIAFELNGIFHYEPIYGSDKLASIKNNDTRKFQACLEKGIELVIIDTSGQKYTKPKTSQKYLDIITNIINLKIDKNYM